MVFVVAVLQRTRLVKDGKYDLQVQTVERDMKVNMRKHSWRKNKRGFWWHDEAWKNKSSRLLCNTTYEWGTHNAWWYWWIIRQTSYGSTSFQTSSSKETWLSAIFRQSPELVDLDIMEATVSKSVRELKGAAGAGVTYSETITSWLLKSETHSQRFRTFGKMAVKWQSSLGCPLCFDGWPSHCTWQKSRSSSHCHRRSIATTYC